MYKLAKRICRVVNKEWYAFPLGTYECGREQCTFYFTDLLIPEQIASQAHVDIPAESTAKVLEEIQRMGDSSRSIMLGMWHSHGNFAVFHSSEDLMNIERIYSTFVGYLPSHYVSETPISFALSDVLNIEPILDGGFKGIRINAGTISLEFDFRTRVKDKSFFAKWYLHFAELKLLAEIVREIYGADPIVKGIIKNKAVFVVSVVINNAGNLDARVFVYENVQGRIKKYSAKADIELKELKKPELLREDDLSSIIQRIR